MSVRRELGDHLIGVSRIDPRIPRYPHVRVHRPVHEELFGSLEVLPSERAL